MDDHPTLEDRVGSAVHAQFNALPRRSKPTIRPNGKREWVPLSGIVLVKGQSTPEESLTCVAVATGAKCLSMSQVSRGRGLVLHDGHAEILALRAFNHWILQECKSMLMQNVEHPLANQPETRNRESGGAVAPTSQSDDGSSSSSRSGFLQWGRGFGKRTTGSDARNLEEECMNSDSWPPFEICEDVDIWMYCTCAPCGDASMELCMAAQEDPTPWESPSREGLNQVDKSDPTKQLLNGRGYFSILGAVRRKPSRADAEPTLSKSCSDKLAAKQVTSLLSFPTSLLLAPTQNAYLKTLLLPEDEISRVACDRCFGSGDSGRLKSLRDKIWTSDYSPGVEYAFRPFTVRSLPTDRVESLWEFGKPKDPAEAQKYYTPSNTSSIWIAAPLDVSAAQLSNQLSPSATALNETLINGVRQGYHVWSPSGRKASVTSRAKLWELLREAIQLVPTGKVMSGNDDFSSAVGKDERRQSEVEVIDDQRVAVKPEPSVPCLLRAPTYGYLKHQVTKAGVAQLRSQVLADVRRVLGNWIQNRRDEEWGLDVLRADKVSKDSHAVSH